MNRNTPSQTLELSPTRQKLRDKVNELALEVGGDTLDVVRMGRIELWPGKILVAQVLDTTAILRRGGGETTEDLFALTVHDGAGTEIESLALDVTSGRVDAVVEESDLYTGIQLGAPDGAIESFFIRYWLDNQDTT